MSRATGALAVFASIGVLVVTYYILRVLRAFSIYFLPSKIQIYHHGVQPYSLITGASDGIGLALADELSARGFNIILHGRNPAKLSAVVRSLSAKFPTRSYKVLVADAITFPGNGYDALIEPIKNLNITILINNIGNTGGATNTPIAALTATTHEELDALLNLNVRFMMHLTRAVLPILRHQQGPALIVNCGSVVKVGIPFLEAYSASKAFVAAWSRALSIELGPYGEKSKVSVMHAIIGEVVTPSNAVEATGVKITAPKMAKELVDRVGCGSWEVTPWIGHMVAQPGFMPNWLFERVMGPMLKGMAGKEVVVSDHFDWEGKKVA